ncbi:DUF2637 domain-containing protein [Pseudonocardia nigra]|uniref:DUF2637 domain-containing protein n=1 Tax=Pseudonocardia nigra TaxID=1921578 RepID=UPI001C6001E4|nr:DUF2637 domain-containing protein [Pseudonocardia nigra]
MSARTVLYLLLLVVAAAAAVLSFAALRDLALVCGFDGRLAWLLPVVVDAGAAAGSLVWLGGRVNDSARTFARALALALLGLSVAANALGHGLAAFSIAPAWWVVVAVSAFAPAVLGAVVHLAVLVGRPHDGEGEDQAGPDPLVVVDEVAQLHTAIGAAVESGQLDEHGMSRFWEHARPAAPSRRDRAAELIAAGAGRRRLSRELGISEYEARQLLGRTRTSNGTSAANPNAAHVTADRSTDSTGTGQDAALERVHAVNGAGRSTS